MARRSSMKKQIGWLAKGGNHDPRSGERGHIHDGCLLDTHNRTFLVSVSAKTHFQSYVFYERLCLGCVFFVFCVRSSVVRSLASHGGEQQLLQRYLLVCVARLSTATSTAAVA